MIAKKPRRARAGRAALASRPALCAALAGCALTGMAEAHHTYTMFDGSKTLTVTGTVAKLEWMNPHVFIWVYVPNADTEGGYDLYAFENGSINVLARMGWSKTTFAAGETISVDYWPLRDGRTGGHFVQATYADGRVIRGAGGRSNALPDFDRAEQPESPRQ